MESEREVQNDTVLIKVYACWENENPMQIFQLSAKGQEEYLMLLKHLELFAQFLPYLTEAEKESRDKNLQHEFQRKVTLANLLTAVQLNHNDKPQRIMPIMEPHLENSTSEGMETKSQLKENEP